MYDTQSSFLCIIKQIVTGVSDPYHSLIYINQDSMHSISQHSVHLLNVFVSKSHSIFPASCVKVNCLFAQMPVVFITGKLEQTVLHYNNCSGTGHSERRNHAPKNVCNTSPQVICIESDLIFVRRTIRVSQPLMFSKQFFR